MGTVLRKTGWGKIAIVVLAAACGSLTLLYPQWRAFAQAQGYSKQIIYLDWSNPTSVTFKKKVRKIGGIESEEYVVDDSKKGEMPTGVQDAYKQGVLTSVHNIFFNSGIYIPVEEYNGQSRADDQLYIRFHKDLPVFTSGLKCSSGEPLIGQSRLNGLAWQGVDRFNKSLGNEVAVFLDPVSDQIADVASTVAHEAGHAMGLRHIIGFPEPREVMDYDSVIVAEQFASIPFQIFEPPSNDILKTRPECIKPDRGAGDHNPTYHLRRYAVGENPSNINVSPGQWDLGYFKRWLLTVRRLVIKKVYDIAAMEPAGTSFGIGSEGQPVFGFFESVDVDNPEGLQWVVPEGVPVQVLASSRPGEEWDLFFTTTQVVEGVPLDSVSTVLTPRDLEVRDIEGQIVKFDELTGEFRVVGSFSATSEEVATVSAEDSLAVTPDWLQFGRVTLGESKDLLITLQNTGVENLQGSCRVASPFILPGGCNFTLLPGESTGVLVRYSPEIIEPVSGHVLISSTGGDGVVVARGRGDDGDGVPYDIDACPKSDLSATVVIGSCDSGVENKVLDAGTGFPGCTIADKVSECGVNAGNHGAFVSCVAELTNMLKSNSEISGREKGHIQSCAAQSSMGAALLERRAVAPRINKLRRAGGNLGWRIHPISPGFHGTLRND